MAPRDPQRTRQSSENSVSSGVIRTSGANLGYRFDGPEDGPVLVLSNSLGTTMELWNAQVAAFMGYFRVLRYDHRGHGDSLATGGPRPYSIDDLGQDLLELLDALSIERASICGISLGGMVAAWLASSRPDRVNRLVLACTAPRFGPSTNWVERAAAVRQNGVDHLLETLLDRWFPSPFVIDHPDVEARVAAMLRTCDTEGYAACCEAIGAMDLWPVLPHIEAPTLVIAGLADVVSPPSVSLAMCEALPRASLNVLRDAAHLANLSQPGQFNAAALEHLAGNAFDRGMEVRRAVLGDRHVDAATRRTSRLRAPFEDLITRYAWGEIWSRPGLDRRTRSAVTVALLAALGRSEELKFHIPAALNNGMTADEVGEVLLQCAVYAGVPAANSALAVAERALGEVDDRTAGSGTGTRA
jgi:3-oxoadipate enol-lactonase/4-carboxymuconolactone decarboxylase